MFFFPLTEITPLIKNCLPNIFVIPDLTHFVDFLLYGCLVETLFNLGS